MVEGLVENQFFRLPDRFQYKRLAVITPVSANTEANLAWVRVLVEGICDSDERISPSVRTHDETPGTSSMKAYDR